MLSRHPDGQPSTFGRAYRLRFLALLIAGIGFTVYSLNRDIDNSGATLTFLPFLLLGVSLLIALGFELVNGFHDTANAVATVIYTHSLAPHVAVVWSGSAADMYGLPVSTTHVLSSGVAGTMAANGAGLQWSTVRNLAMAWVLTMPAAIALSAASTSYSGTSSGLRSAPSWPGLSHGCPV